MNSNEYDLMAREILEARYSRSASRGGIIKELPWPIAAKLARSGVVSLERLQEIYKVGGVEILKIIPNIGEKTVYDIQKAVDDGLFDLIEKPVMYQRVFENMDGDTVTLHGTAIAYMVYIGVEDSKMNGTNEKELEQVGTIYMTAGGEGFEVDQENWDLVKSWLR